MADGAAPRPVAALAVLVGIARLADVAEPPEREGEERVSGDLDMFSHRMIKFDVHIIDIMNTLDIEDDSESGYLWLMLADRESRFAYAHQ